MRPQRFLLLLVGTVGSALAVAPSAQATTFCVGGPCAGTPSASLQAALDSAAAAAGSDVILIAPGTYDGPFTYNSTQPLTITGAGVGQTVLRTTTEVLASQATIALNGDVPSALVLEDATVEVANCVSGTVVNAVYLTDATARDVRLTRGASSCNGAKGASLGDAGQLERVTIDLTGAASQTGVHVLNAAGSSVVDSVIETPGGTGVTVNNTAADTDVVRSRIRANIGVNHAWGDLELTSSIVQATAGGTGLLVRSQNASQTTTLVARGTTILGSGSTNGVYAGNNENGSTSTIELRSSTVSGFTTTFRRDANEGSGVGTANIVVSYTNRIPLTATQDGAGAITNGSGNLSADPLFVDASAGDLRIAAASPLRDAGDPSVDAAFGTLDVASLPRLVGPVRDMGAHEYQRAAPAVVAAAEAIAPLTGRFTATGSDADGDPLTYSWSFDDGTAAAGATVDHAFAAPGPHSATVTVTDALGQTASASVTVTVAAPAPAPGTGPPGGPGPSATDRTAPVLTGVRFDRARISLAGRNPRGGLLRLTSSEAASLRVVLERKRTGRRSGKRCVAPTAKLRRAKRCSRYTEVRVLTRAIAAGATSLRLPAKVGGKRLPRGVYRVRVRATDAAGNRSAEVRRTLTVR